MSRIPTVTLEDVCGKGQYGANARAQNEEQAIRYLRITDITDDGHLRKDNPAYADLSTIEQAKYRLVKNDLVIARSGSVGKAYMHDVADGPLIFAGYLVRFKPDLSRINPRYLQYFTRSPMYWRQIEVATRTVSQPNVSERRMADIKIPLPPLPEQKRIAAILEKVDGVRRKMQARRIQLHVLIQSWFLELFGDPFINNKRWKIEKLPEAGTLERGKSRHRPRDAEHLLGGPYPLIQTGDVANSGEIITKYDETYSEAELMQSRLWPKNTLCITIAANIGRTGILDFDACFPDSIVGFTPNQKVEVIFVREWFELIRQGLEERAPAVAQKNINLETLRALNIILPPLTLQREFATRVTAIRHLEEKQKQAAQDAGDLFQSLLQRAFQSSV